MTKPQTPQRSRATARSTARSLNRTGGRRIIDRLLYSGGKLALVGLANALATLAFTVWLQSLVRHQIEVGEPLARTALEVQTSLAQSFSALRSWVAWGEPTARAERRRVWTERIEPQMIILRQAAEGHQDEAVRRDVQRFEAELRELKYLQWMVEDIAQTPSNRPAEAAYEQQLRPLRNSLLEALAHDPSSKPKTSALSDEVLAFAKTFLETDRALFEVLRDYTPARNSQVLRLARQLANQQLPLQTRIGKLPESDHTAALRFALREATAYADRIEDALELRRGADANLSRALFAKELKPLQTSIVEVTERIAQRQIEFVERQGQGLFRLSFVVLALALLMGVLSIVAIYVSHRLEYRVRDALAQAKSLGQYVIGARIGGGAMGEVYQARHALLRRPSAIKILRTSDMQDPLAQDRFREEVQLTSQLSHPNTIAIFDYGQTPEGLFYYAMELLNGVALKTLVDVSGPMAPARVVHVLSQVCASLHEAHTKGLIHRDIKPSNIMLSELGGVYDMVKVLDFGLAARVADPETHNSKSSNLVGTPMYIAPEVVQSPQSASPASDIYAVGAVGYFLVTATPVFPSQDITEVLRCHLEEEPERPSSRLGGPVPEELEVLILGCLAKDPGDRPQSARHLRSMLAEVPRSHWTPEDAELWWEEYGEAMKSAVGAYEADTGGSRTPRAPVKVAPSPFA